RKFTPPPSPTAVYCNISEDDDNQFRNIINSSAGRDAKLMSSKSNAVKPNYWRMLSYAIYTFVILLLKLIFLGSMR
ncbi:hypothetical protein HOY82DRAFT_476039, partial [Tuber indicum]